MCILFVAVAYLFTVYYCYSVCIHSTMLYIHYTLPNCVPYFTVCVYIIYTCRYLEETRSTLQFASRAKLVTTHATVNEVYILILVMLPTYLPRHLYLTNACMCAVYTNLPAYLNFPSYLTNLCMCIYIYSYIRICIYTYMYIYILILMLPAYILPVPY